MCKREITPAVMAHIYMNADQTNVDVFGDDVSIF